jgi:uncharacterized protein YdhG (YjbR/CyaY superfamily)
MSQVTHPAERASVATIDDYVGACPAEAQTVLKEVLRRVRAASPGAEESIRYGMPAFKLPNGHPTYVAAWKRHIGFHDVPNLGRALERQLAPYRSGRDTLRFPLRNKVPYGLIEQAVRAMSRIGSR